MNHSSTWTNLRGSFITWIAPSSDFLSRSMRAEGTWPANFSASPWKQWPVEHQHHKFTSCSSQCQHGWRGPVKCHTDCGSRKWGWFPRKQKATCGSMSVWLGGCHNGILNCKTLKTLKMERNILPFNINIITWMECLVCILSKV